jgi:hypothetical protein
LAELGAILEVSRGRAGQLVRRALAELARRAGFDARNEREAPTAWWGRRPSAARGLLRMMVAHSDGFHHFAALAGATEDMVVSLVSERAGAGSSDLQPMADRPAEPPADLAMP